MDFNDLMRSFVEKVNLTGVDPTGDEIALVIDGMPVSFFNEREQNRMLIVGQIGEPPTEGDDAFARMLLRANHLFSGTADATLSQDEQTRIYHLCRRLNLDGLDLEGFEAQAGTFVDALESWRGVLADFRPVAEAASLHRQSQPSEWTTFVNRDFIRA